MPLHHASSRHRRSALAAPGVAIALALTLAGCSRGAETPESGRQDAGGKSVRAESELVLNTTVARVAGELTPAQRGRLEREAGRLLDRYVSAAYLRQRPTTGYRGAFPGFTPHATALANQDVATTADGGYRWATAVRPVEAVAFLSVVSPERRPAGATARVSLTLEATDDRRRREVAVQGRLLLTPAGKRWKIFGYDLAVASRPLTRSSR